MDSLLPLSDGRIVVCCMHADTPANLAPPHWPCRPAFFRALEKAIQAMSDAIKQGEVQLRQAKAAAEVEATAGASAAAAAQCSKLSTRERYLSKRRSLAALYVCAATLCTAPTLQARVSPGVRSHAASHVRHTMPLQCCPAHSPSPVPAAFRSQTAGLRPNCQQTSRSSRAGRPLWLSC